MRAGLLRQRVTLQSVTESPDSFGETLPVWTTYANLIPAHVTPMSGNEANRNQQVSSEVTHKVIIRYSSAVAGVKASDRILMGERHFDIRSVINTGERDRQLEIMCIERFGPIFLPPPIPPDPTDPPTDPSGEFAIEVDEDEIVIGDFELEEDD